MHNSCFMKQDVNKFLCTGLEMTSPVIRIVNPGAPLNRQQAVLLATKESGLYRDKKLWFPVPHPELLYQATALECAEKLLRADGVSSPTRQQRLGKLVFGDLLGSGDAP
uniref:Uncharacterized protein n=1 Tax=Nothobranchius furzeri TaxID=105023 RepID=A0A1A8AQN2_NOTFU